MFFHGILLLRRFFIVLWCFIMSKKSIMFSSINIDYGDVFLAFTMALSCTISSNEFKWFWFKRFCGQFGSVQVSRFLNGSVWTLSNRTKPLQIVTFIFDYFQKMSLTFEAICKFLYPSVHWMNNYILGMVKSVDSDTKTISMRAFVNMVYGFSWDMTWEQEGHGRNQRKEATLRRFLVRELYL